tara:strand:+ start:17271 stop:18029 length:759 start_codon:yes stop_codon:yes gene_type:complete
MNPKERELLKDNIRRLVRFVKQKKLNEQEKMKEALKKLMILELQSMLSEKQTPDVNPTPNKSTGINVLEDLLKKIVPVLEMDYKQLTTDIEQRTSFRSHIINAVITTLTPAEINNEAGPEDLEEQDIEVQVGDEEGDKFIDIRTDAEKADEEEPVDPKDEFGSGIEGDETGRNMAYSSFKKIETSVIDSYELLSNPEDQELFYDYLIANLKLYFDKFEDELDPSVSEPTNQAYDMAAEDPMGGEDELDIDLG